MISRTDDTGPHDARTSRVIAPEIAAKYGRSVTTVQKDWMTREDWPPTIGRRGRWNEYDAATVDRVVRASYLRTEPTQAGNPDDLLTIIEIADRAGVNPSTVRGYLSRGQLALGEPDDTSHGVHRWYRWRVDQALRGRRGYRRVLPTVGD